MSELKPGEGKYVEIDGFQLAVFINDGHVSVLDNTCPHAGGNLAGGYVDEGCAVCPWHYWAFRLDNGELRDMPGVKVTKYESRLLDHGGKQLVQADLPMP
jgi:nitrite reductase/ring-hydroxylating ferredoxin subunit